MHKIEKFKEFIEEELDKIRKKGDLNAAELESAEKAIDILKDISIIEGMESYSDGGYYAEDEYGSYGRMYPQTAEWRKSYPFYGARRRDSKGRYMDYMPRGRYRDSEAHDKMSKYLESKMKNASTDEEKEIIRRCMEEIEMA